MLGRKELRYVAVVVVGARNPKDWEKLLKTMMLVSGNRILLC